MTIHTLIIFDDDGVISHIEHYSERPTIAMMELDDGPNTPSYALYEGNLDGGDTVCTRNYQPEVN